MNKHLAPWFRITLYVSAAVVQQTDVQGWVNAQNAVLAELREPANADLTRFTIDQRIGNGLVNIVDRATSVKS